MNILQAFFGTEGHASVADTTGESPGPDPKDIWAFTDPDARQEHARAGKLPELEHDGRYEVLRGGPWLPEELECKREIRRLLGEEGRDCRGQRQLLVYQSVPDGVPRVVVDRYEENRDEDLHQAQEIGPPAAYQRFRLSGWRSRRSLPAAHR